MRHINIAASPPTAFGKMRMRRYIAAAAEEARNAPLQHPIMQMLQSAGFATATIGGDSDDDAGGMPPDKSRMN